MLFISALAYLTAVGVLGLWLCLAALKLATGKGEKPARILPQLITFSATLALGVGVWFLFDLSAKLDFDKPVLLWLTTIALPIFALGVWSLQQLGPARRWASVYLRTFVLLLLVSILAGFRTVQTHDELTVVTLIDTSESVRRFFNTPKDANGNTQDYQQWLASYFKEAGKDKRSDDYWSAQTFDGRPTVLLSPSLGEVTLPLGAIDQPYDGSNGQRAVESGMTAKAQADSALRMLLVSDGNLDGEVMMAAQAAAAAGVPIDVLPLQYKVNGEVMIEAVRATPRT